MAQVEEDVKRRSYDGTARKERSIETRQRIIEAARSLMMANGYRATTVAAVATRADVNVDTVYELVGRKPVLLKELIEQAISGADHAVAAEDRGYVQAVKAEPDPAIKLAIYARAIRRTQERMAPLVLALRDASSTEPAAEQVWREISDRRATNMRLLVKDIQNTGRLRPGLSVNEAADVVWALNSSEFYVLLTVDRGWSSHRFESWLADAWARLLLD